MVILGLFKPRSIKYFALASLGKGSYSTETLNDEPASGGIGIGVGDTGWDDEAEGKELSDPPPPPPQLTSKKITATSISFRCSGRNIIKLLYLLLFSLFYKFLFSRLIKL
jgi:hypothetical protein